MKKILALFACFLFTISFAAQAATFSDVSSENPHSSSILELQSRGVIQGYMDGTFRPNQAINRVEFLKILTETKGDYSPSRDPSGYDIEVPIGLAFSDVQDKAWFVPYIRHALQKEIISGYPNGTFQPTRNVNLAEALKMIFKTFNIPTVQFIRAPDNWYDYYTTALESDFEAETGLNPQTDIGKELTRGEMASLIIYLEMRSPEKNL